MGKEKFDQKLIKLLESNPHFVSEYICSNAKRVCGFANRQLFYLGIAEAL